MVNCIREKKKRGSEGICMKKKLLFVNPSLCSGGAEKSLVTLLSMIDYSRYDVDLFLFRREGLFLPLVPEQVRILDAGEDYRMFDGNARAALRYFLGRGKLRTAARRVLYARRVAHADGEDIAQVWRSLAPMLPKLSGYDAAVAYLEGPATYFVIDRVEAAKKIAFLHIDYDFIAHRKAFDTEYYKKIDTLVSVSQECCEKAVQYFPFLDGKVCHLQNIVVPAFIRKMAQQSAEFPNAGQSTILLTVGRLSAQKRLDRAVEACARLLESGYDVRWYLIGVGVLESQLREQAQSLGLGDRFVFLGEQSNPYPFLRMCDIYVQTSQYEGKSIAIDEAKCLAKPIVVTNFETVFDQITDGVNGLITEMEPKKIAQAVGRLIDEPALRQSLSDALSQEKVGNEEEIQKFYALLESAM